MNNECHLHFRFSLEKSLHVFPFNFFLPILILMTLNSYIMFGSKRIKKRRVNGKVRSLFFFFFQKKK